MANNFTLTFKGTQYLFQIVSAGYVSPITGEVIPFSAQPHVTLTKHIQKYS